MASLAVLATTVLPTAVGLLAVRGNPLTRLGLAGLLGISAVGLGGMLGGFVGLVLPGAIIGLVVLGIVGHRYPLRRTEEPAPMLGRVLLGLVVVAGLALVILAYFRPIGYWDAWAIWGLKAKGLAVANGFSSAVFSEGTYAYSLPEYPPVQPVWQSLAYEVAGTLRANWMLQVQLAWIWLCGGLAITGVASAWRGAAAVVPFAWLMAPGVIGRSLSGYADVPMAILLIAGALVLWQARGNREALYAGLLLGASALVKSEGLVAAVAVVVAYGIQAGARRPAGSAAAVLVAMQLPWMVLVRVRGISNTIINPETLTTSRLIEVVPQRFEMVVRAFGAELADITRWGPLVVLIIVVLAIGRPDGRLALATGTLFVFLGIIYLVTPLEVDRHISRSIDRVHIAPLGLLAVTGATALHRRATRDPTRVERTPGE